MLMQLENTPIGTPSDEKIMLLYMLENTDSSGVMTISARNCCSHFSWGFRRFQNFLEKLSKMDILRTERQQGRQQLIRFVPTRYRERVNSNDNTLTTISEQNDKGAIKMHLENHQIVAPDWNKLLDILKEVTGRKFRMITKECKQEFMNRFAEGFTRS